MGQPLPADSQKTTGRQKMSPLAVLITAVLSLAISGALIYLCLKLLQAAVG